MFVDEYITNLRAALLFSPRRQGEEEGEGVGEGGERYSAIQPPFRIPEVAVTAAASGNRKRGLSLPKFVTDENVDDPNEKENEKEKKQD